MKALINFFDQLNPYSRRRNIMNLVAACDQRLQILQKLKVYSGHYRILDNSILESLHRNLKIQRIYALHQQRIHQIINNS